MKAPRLTAKKMRELLEVLERVRYDANPTAQIFYPPDFVGPPAPLTDATAVGVAKATLKIALGEPL